jgi:hypothetical protein
MQLYMSGTPTNDVFQIVENRLCKCRLFSMHPNYRREVMRWLDDVWRTPIPTPSMSDGLGGALNRGMRC